MRISEEKGLFSLCDRVYEPQNLYDPSDWMWYYTVSNNITNDWLWSLVKIQAADAWDITKGDSTIKIAVVDDGFDYLHPELQSKIYPPYDFYTGIQEPTNKDHGTSVASILAAETVDQGETPMGSMASIGYNSIIMVSQYELQACLYASTVLNAEILSISWYYDCEPSYYYLAIEQEILNNGTLIVRAAGNGSAYCGGGRLYPFSGHEDNRVIVVSSTDFEDYHSSPFDSVETVSHYPEVTICAPGYHIMGAKHSHNGTVGWPYFGGWGGTSQSTPIVAGVCALVKSVNKCLTPEDIQDIIKQTADPIQDAILYPGMVGAGRINAYQAVFLAQTYHNNNDTITSDATWSTNSYRGGDIVIDSLSTLTITGTLHCSSSARIIVKPGGKLVVDGGTLTSACAGEMWQGVYVEGHRDQPQTAANQGTVQLINGAVVENAFRGIRTSAPGSGWNTTGGIITADSATFRNCAKAVEYLSYAGTNYAGQVVDNKGSFTGCTFTVDDNNLFAANGTDLLAHVSLWDVKGVEFTHCRFEDARTGNHSRKSAISALDAGFEMKTGCSYNVPRPECDCPPASSTHSSFAGFGTAIDAGTSGSPYGIVIDGAQFSDNIIGVRIGGSSHATVTRCQFDLGETSVRAVIGLSLNGCTGYLVEENTFTRDASAPSGSRYGIRVNNSGTDANGLYRNTFERLSHGIYVTGTNGDGNSNTGLQMTCNGFTSNTYDIYVASGATVGPMQGSSIKEAGNTFSGTQTSSLYNAGSLGINYYYSTGTNHALQNPVGNVTLHTNAGSNDCASTLCVLDPSIPGPGPKSPTPSFLALKQQYENLMADFDRNGYADLLSTAIPPQSGGTPNVNQETIEAAQYASQQINSIASDLFAQSHERVRALMADTLENLQAVMAWLDATPGLASRYLEAETEFVVEANDNSPIQDVATHLTTTTERDEYDNYMAFHTLKQALEEGGHVMWPNATDAQIGELIRIADANTGRSSLLAKNVLCFFFGICYDDTETRAFETTTIPPTAEPPTLTESRMKAESPITGQQNITVHPNPTDDVLHVTVTDGEIARVEMFDMFGRITMVGTQNLASPPSPEYTVDLSSLPSGLYLLRVTLTDGTVRNVKVVRK
jgi:subtilisin family serine protease